MTSAVADQQPTPRPSETFLTEGRAVRIRLRCRGQGRDRTVDLPIFSRLRQPPPRSSVVGLDDGHTVSGPLHRSAPVLRRGERVVCLAHGNDLAVPGLQSEAQPRAPDGHTQPGPATAYAPSPEEGRAGLLGLVRDCADVVGFDVAAPLPCCPCDSITAGNPSPSGVSRSVPVAPTPCTTPLESMTIRTRVGSLQPSPLALLALHLAA